MEGAEIGQTAKQILYKLPSLGQANKAQSIPVVLPTDFQLDIQNEANVLSRKAFSVTTNDLTSGTAIETPRLLVINPANSGKLMKFTVITVGTNVSTNNNIFRFYSKPTVTANGTPLTPVNMYLESSTVGSAMQLFSNPTISANGNLFLNVIAGATSTIPVPLPQKPILAPGQMLLITVRPNTTSVTYSINYE